MVIDRLSKSSFCYSSTSETNKNIPSLMSLQLSPPALSKKKVLEIFTDGSYIDPKDRRRGHGDPLPLPDGPCSAGIGIFCADEGFRFLKTSDRLPAIVKSSVESEIAAVDKLLDLIGNERNIDRFRGYEIVVKTDLKSTVDAMRDRKFKGPMAPQFQSLAEKLDILKQRHHLEILVQKVKSREPGNVEADALARKAAKSKAERHSTSKSPIPENVTDSTGRNNRRGRERDRDVTRASDVVEVPLRSDGRRRNSNRQEAIHPPTPCTTSCELFVSAYTSEVDQGSSAAGYGIFCHDMPFLKTSNSFLFDGSSPLAVVTMERLVTVVEKHRDQLLKMKVNNVVIKLDNSVRLDSEECKCEAYNWLMKQRYEDAKTALGKLFNVSFDNQMNYDDEGGFEKARHLALKAYESFRWRKEKRG